MGFIAVRASNANGWLLSLANIPEFLFTMQIKTNNIEKLGLIIWPNRETDLMSKLVTDKIDNKYIGAL